MMQINYGIVMYNVKKKKKDSNNLILMLQDKTGKMYQVEAKKIILYYYERKAYELLKNPKLSVGDVSRSVGYMDPLTFSKTFKKYSGYSPKQYRENIHKNKL